MISEHIEALYTLQNNNKQLLTLHDLIGGRVVFTGLGKSGMVALRAAASWRSVGIDAAFMHAADGEHGDGSLVLRADLLVCLSQSGHTQEVTGWASQHRKVLALTGDLSSPLAQQALFVINTALPDDWVEPVPLVSCTLQAVALDTILQRYIDRMQPAEFTRQIAANHPGGAIGKRMSS